MRARGREIGPARICGPEIASNENRTLEWKRCASFDLVMTKGDRYPGAGLVF
jgi:hypothetical protein